MQDIDKYAATLSATSATLGTDDTLGKALNDLGDAFRQPLGFAAVSTTASIADARTQLKLKPQCKDVFVTDGGAETDKVVGWLTNTDLTRGSS